MNKKRLIIFGNTKDFAIADRLLAGRNFEIVGGLIDPVADKINQENQRKFLETNSLPELHLDTIQSVKPDIGFAIHYGKIIPAAVLSDFFVLNLHGGLLPKWRGLNASCWAIINGEDEVGYTLHQMNKGLDTGPIYHKFICRIEKDEHYAEVVPRIHTQVIENINNIVSDIIEGKLNPVSQDGMPHIYTTKLRPEVGYIRNWNITTDYIYNLYRVLGAPYGTGIYFDYRGKKYEITKLSRKSAIVDYIGITGVIVLIDGESAVVKTKDNVISIDELKLEGEIITPSSLFRIGNKI